MGQAVVLWSRKVEQTEWRRSTVIGLVIVNQAAVLWSRQVEQIYRRRSTVEGLVIVNQAADDLIVKFLNTGSICFEPNPPQPHPIPHTQQ